MGINSDDSALMWMRVQRERWTEDGPVIAPLEAIDKSEQAGRMQLFTGAYQAFRNSRAHRALARTVADELAEFLVLNQLFLLEGVARERVDFEEAAPAK